MRSLALDLDFAPQRRLVFKLTGQVQIFGAQIAVSVEQNEGGWKIEGQSGPITIGQIVNSTLAHNLSGRTNIQLHSSIQDLGLAHVGVTIEKTDSTTLMVDGALKHWILPFSSGPSIEVDAAVTFTVTKPATGAPVVGGSVTGAVSFAGFSDLEFFQHIRVTATFEFGTTPAIGLQLALGNLVLNGSYTSGSAPTLTFSFAGTTLTVGDVVTAMVNLIDPDAEDFQFDEPWDKVCSLTLSACPTSV